MCLCVFVSLDSQVLYIYVSKLLKSLSIIRLIVDYKCTYNTCICPVPSFQKNIFLYYNMFVLIHDLYRNRVFRKFLDF